MKKIRCKTCYGSGKIMGGGMIMKECDTCDGNGKIIEPEDDVDYLDMKSTAAYQEAKDKLTANHNLSDKDAEELLDNALKNESTKPKKKRA